VCANMVQKHVFIGRSLPIASPLGCRNDAALPIALRDVIIRSISRRR
jgi:hypothetical protein